MAERARWHLLFYDIRDPKRWRRVYRLMQGYGDHLQYSVFRVKGTRLHVERMQWELERLLDQDDALLVVPLCPGCAERIRTRNAEGAWPDESPQVRIVE